MSSPLFDISKSASLSDLENYSNFSIQEQEEKNKMPLHAIGAWTKSMVSATVPEKSAVRVSVKNLDQLAQQKLKELALPIPDDATFEEAAKILNGRLGELSIIRGNLETHDRVIQAYNKRFIFKDASVAACSTHDASIKKLDELKAKLNKDLHERMDVHKEEIINSVSVQILSGMPVDRDFLRNIYPAIIQKFDQFPSKARTAALDKLHQVLNTGYVATLNDRLVNDYRSVLPVGLEVVLKKFDLGHLLEGENIERAVQFMSNELSNEIHRSDLGSISLPDYVELLQLKFLAYGEQLIREKIPDIAQRDAFLLFMKENHQVELHLKALHDKPDRIISREQLREKIAVEWQQILEEADLEQVNDAGLDRICNDVEEALRKYDPRTELANFHKKQTREELLSPDYSKKMHNFASKKQNWKEFVETTVANVTDRYLNRIVDWEKRNKKNQNFVFVQERAGADYVLGKGCCWAISLDWHQRLKASGKNIPDYATFMKTNKSSLETASLATKPTMKQFTAEIQKKMAKSIITPRMRRLQALANLEANLGGKSQDIVAEKFGYEVKDYTDASDNPHIFLQELIAKEENAFKKAEPTPLSEERGILEVHTSSPESAHRLEVQVNFKEGIFRLIDSNGGMWTYPDKETFLKEAGEYLEAKYPNHNEIVGILYSEKPAA